MKKDPGATTKPNLAFRERRIKRIADAIGAIQHHEPLSANDRDFICRALYAISKGQNPHNELDLAAKRGEKRGQSFTRKDLEDLIITDLMLIATLTQPPPDGDGLTAAEAIRRVSEPDQSAFVGSGLSEETLRKYWHKNPHLQAPRFSSNARLLPLDDDQTPSAPVARP